MSRKPDYRVAAMNKVTDDKSQIGAAWANKDGSITIVLDSFVHLDGGKALLVTLFPNIEETK
jgi:hypothetical protein